MDRGETFRALHEAPFIMPNPWDRGSTKILATLGFPALATTSAGFANSLGRQDGRVSRDEAIAYARQIVEAGREPLDKGTHDFRTKAVGSMGVVMSAMASQE